MPDKTNTTSNESNENVSWMAEMRAIHAKYFANKANQDKPALSIDEQRKLHQCWSGIFFWATIILVAIPVIAAHFGAESVGAEANVGIAERAERLIVALLAALLQGLGLEWALPVALPVLALLIVITVGQRFAHVRRQLTKPVSANEGQEDDE